MILLGADLNRVSRFCDPATTLANPVRDWRIYYKGAQSLIATAGEP